MGRRVWSDPRIRILAKKFVPAADEVWRLQNAPDPECRFFRKSVAGQEAPVGHSLQGTYVFSPSGKLLASRNSNASGDILGVLESGLERWQALAPSERKLSDPKLVSAGFRWEQSYPVGGLHLRRTARDLPTDNLPTSDRGDRFNRDAVWFSAGEARSLLPATLETGQRQRWPSALTKRLSCLVFVDNVRGQTVPYHPSEDVDSELWSEVTHITKEHIELQIRGRTAATAKGPWLFDETNLWTPPSERRTAHSIESQVLGSAVFDRSTNRFSAFDLLALGVRRGRTVNQGRISDAASGIGFVCERAPDSWQIAPTFIDVYAVDWVAQPKSSTR